MGMNRCKSMVILRNSLYNSALFGLGNVMTPVSPWFFNVFDLIWRIWSSEKFDAPSYLSSVETCEDLKIVSALGIFLSPPASQDKRSQLRWSKASYMCVCIYLHECIYCTLYATYIYIRINIFFHACAVHLCRQCAFVSIHGHPTYT